jgi:hypothetical protein
MHDLTAKRETAVPEFHHVIEVFEPVATRERFTLAAIENDAVNRHAEKENRIVVEKTLGVMFDRDRFDPGAWDAHEETRALRAESGV